MFSEGSAAIVRAPGLERRMLTIARRGLLVGLLGTLGLTYISERELWPIFIFIYLSAAFLSKYYNAEPIRFAYRGLGEIVIQFGFGPFAILLGQLLRESPQDPLIVSIIPATGRSTLIFAGGGEMVDMPYDLKAGRWGLVIRPGGLRNGTYGLMILHALLIANILFAAYMFDQGWTIILALVPYVLMLPKVFSLLMEGVEGRKEIYERARLNFLNFQCF